MPATPRPDVSVPWGQNGLITDPGLVKRGQGYIAEIPDYDVFNWIINNLGVAAKYLFENGIADYAADTTYWTGSIVKDPATGRLFQSLDDDNTGNPLSDPTKWSSDFVGGGVRWSRQTANFTTEAGQGYMISGAIVPTLHADPADGDEVDFVDFAGTWAATPVSVAGGGGKNIQEPGGVAAASYMLNKKGGFYRFVFSAADDVWLVATKSYESPHLGKDHNIRTNPDTINEDLTLTAGNNGSSVGPLTIANGRVVTVNAGAAWSII